ncbi:MAG: Mut7-C RNAse domain-containing protein [Planctomycetia bacterium]|nr:Mut7-C RNAse domain-containing protein [Planctomycetia bacterium]
MKFSCDAMLGGLARWLRAAGYDAAWEAGIDDTALVRQALREGRVLLTSDGGIMKRGTVSTGRVLGLFIPQGLKKFEQLQFVVKKFHLSLLEPRCMKCGGRLKEIPKASARPEAPPRAFAWKDRFFRCSRCAKLFWHGTHWTRISKKLDELRQT